MSTKKKLKKKEHKSAREEENRQRKGLAKGKPPTGPSPMETDMSPHEILADPAHTCHRWRRKNSTEPSSRSRRMRL